MRPVTMVDCRPVVLEQEPTNDVARELRDWLKEHGDRPHVTLSARQMDMLHRAVARMEGQDMQVRSLESRLATVEAERNQLLAAMKRDGWSPLTCGVCYTEYPAPNCPKCSGRRPPTPGDTP